MHGEGEDTTIISVHVDDTSIMSASLPRVLWLKCHLQKEFGIMDDGPTSYFLGIEVVWDMGGRILELHQQKYIRKLCLHSISSYLSSIRMEKNSCLCTTPRQLVHHHFGTFVDEPVTNEDKELMS